MNTQDTPRIDANTAIPPTPKTVVLILAEDHPTTLNELVAACRLEKLKVIVIHDRSAEACHATPADPDIVLCSTTRHSTRLEALRMGAALALKQGFSATITLTTGGDARLASDARRLLDTARRHWPAIIVGESPSDDTAPTTAERLGRMINNFCLRLESGRNLPGNPSTCQLYPLDLLSGKLLSRSDVFETEILVRAAWAGLPIIAIPVGHPVVSRQGGTVKSLRLCALHAWLIALSLMPWRPRPQSSGDRKKNHSASPLLHPVRFIRQLCVEHSSPLELAAAAWVGIFIGALPIIPFGIAAIVYACHRLHLNKLAGAGASNVCIAPFVPFLCIQAGHFVSHGTWWTTFTRHTLVDEIHLRLWEWLLGALIVGPVIATLGGFLTYALIVRLRKDQR